MEKMQRPVERILSPCLEYQDDDVVGSPDTRPSACFFGRSWSWASSAAICFSVTVIAAAFTAPALTAPALTDKSPARAASVTAAGVFAEAADFLVAASFTWSCLSY